MAFKVGVVGAGNMGSGIAQKMAMEGLLVTMVDISDAAVERGLGIMKTMLQQAVSRNVITQAQMDETLSRVKATSSYEELADMDLIVEAVFEDMKVKSEVLAKLDKICKPETILATNTSSFYVRELAKATSRPDRVVGMHYFFHPAKNRLLEVIPHEGTSAETLEKAALIGRLHGKTNIFVKDAPGFCVNRIFIPFYVSAIRAVEEGIANIPTVEEAAKRGFHIGMGLFELMNVTGVPIAEHSANTLGNEISEFYAPPKLLSDQIKTGKNWDLAGEVDESKIEAVKDYLYGCALGIACELVEEGVATIEDTERGAKIGLAWKFGPFEIINNLGINKAYECVKAIADRYPSFKMPSLLEKQYQTGKPFEFKYVDLEYKGEIAFITINRPEAMNALNSSVVAQLEEKFNEAEKNEAVKAVVIQGAGKAFIAGADIKFFVENIKNNSIDKSVEFTAQGHELLRRFETSEKITIALVDGLSLGGGSELALACQAIVATPAGSFGFPESGIGIYPGLGGMIRTARHIGTDLAKYYCFTGRSIKATEAYELGMVTKLVDVAGVDNAIKEVIAASKVDKYAAREIPASYSDKAKVFAAGNVEKVLKGELAEGVDAEFARKTAEIIAVKAPLSLKAINELMDAQAKVSIDEAIKLELGRLVEQFSTEDALAGLSARPGKTVPFQGK